MSRLPIHQCTPSDRCDVGCCCLLLFTSLACGAAAHSTAADAEAGKKVLTNSRLSGTLSCDRLAILP